MHASVAILCVVTLLCQNNLLALTLQECKQELQVLSLQGSAILIISSFSVIFIAEVLLMCFAIRLFQYLTSNYQWHTLWGDQPKAAEEECHLGFFYRPWKLVDNGQQ